MGWGLQGRRAQLRPNITQDPSEQENEPLHACSLRPPHFLCSWQCREGAPQAR